MSNIMHVSINGEDKWIDLEAYSKRIKFGGIEKYLKNSTALSTEERKKYIIDTFGIDILLEFIKQKSETSPKFNEHMKESLGKFSASDNLVKNEDLCDNPLARSLIEKFSEK